MNSLMAIGCTFLIFFLVIIISDIDKPMRSNACVEYHSVTKILELRYRDAVIELDNSTTLVVNQASLKIGDGVCTRYRK